MNDVALLEGLAKEFAGDPAEPDLMFDLAEARYAAKDYPGALSIANTLLPSSALLTGSGRSSTSESPT